LSAADADTFSWQWQKSMSGRQPRCWSRSGAGWNPFVCAVGH